jgi:VanZ family protein
MASSPMAIEIRQPLRAASEPLWFRGQLRAQLRTWLPVLAFAMVFVVESTSYCGADRTSAPLQRLAEAIFGYGVGLHWELIHHLIRKTGHFMGYGVFCLVCFRGFWIELKCAASRLARQLRAHGLAILTTFLVASADEIHQRFVPNRAGQFSDVLLDTCGGVALGLVLFLAMQAAEARRLARERTTCRESACAEAAV